MLPALTVVGLAVYGFYPTLMVLIVVGVALDLVQRIMPQLAPRLKHYNKDYPIFDEYGVQPELDRALRSKVWLKSGGYIVINHTEALVAIDVNTGKFVGKGSTRLEDTIVKTNLEAVKEIVRQIRLRDLGGIIVIDFIDMDERKNRQKIMQALEDTMRSDKAPYKILQFNDFGLVAITRKRVKQSLERTTRNVELLLVADRKARATPAARIAAALTRIPPCKAPEACSSSSCAPGRGARTTRSPPPNNCCARGPGSIRRS